MTIELSICIPTYNREDYIAQTIESVLSQTNNNIEIVISDNASTDNTMEIINKYQTNNTQIVVHSFSINMGADTNFQKLIELAKGDYCLILGSDDVLKKGAIDAFLKEIRKPNTADILIYARDRCNLSLDVCQFETWWSSKKNKIFFDFSKQSLSDYFKICRSIGGLFSFISSIVFKRKKWLKINNNIKYNNTAYSHVYRLLKIILNKGSLLVIQDSFIYCRLGNDSFLDKENPGKRIALDIDGYIKISDEIKEQKDKHSFLNPLRLRKFWFYVYLFQYKKTIMDNDEYTSYNNRLYLLLDFKWHKKLLIFLFLNIKPLFYLLLKVKAIILKILKTPEVSL